MASILKVGFNAEEMHALGDVLLGDEMSMLGNDIWQDSQLSSCLKSSRNNGEVLGTSSTINSDDIAPLPLHGFPTDMDAINETYHHFNTMQDPQSLMIPVPSSNSIIFSNSMAKSLDMNSNNEKLVFGDLFMGTEAFSHLSTTTTPSPSSSTTTTNNLSTNDVLCQTDGCKKRVQHPGLQCKVHTTIKKCIIKGCNKSSQNGDFCIGHGGGKRCKQEGCSKAAQSHGLCKAHGGGARCKFPGCSKSSQGGGLCRAHGGGKRCQAHGCPKGAQRGNFCATHGGFRCCKSEGCVRTDRGGGYCEVHRRDKLCQVNGCKKLSRNMGKCTVHIREHRDQQMAVIKTTIPLHQL